MGLDMDNQSHENTNMSNEVENSRLEIRKKRHLTRKKKLVDKWDGVKIVIEFDDWGIKGNNTRKAVVGWQGHLAKTCIPLNALVKWTDIHKEKHHSLKENLWMHFEARFVVVQTYKKKCLQEIGIMFRNYKHSLTKKYIDPFMDDPDQLFDRPPIDDYPAIITADWNVFVQSRLSEKFQELSLLQSERRSQNQYNHRVSRKGYHGLIEEIRRESGELVDSDIDRSHLWIVARKGKDGEFLNDATREVAKNIDDIKQKIKKGEVETCGTNDILTLALGTPEHPGRVRAVGKNFTPTSYFHIPRRSSKIYTEKLEAKLRTTEDENMELKRKMREYESMMTEKGIFTSPSPSPTIEKVVSNNKRNQPNSIDNPVSLAKKCCPSQDSSLNTNHQQREQCKDRCTTNNKAFSKPKSGQEQSNDRGTTDTAIFSKPKSSVVQHKDNTKKNDVAMPKLNSTSRQAQECSLVLDHIGNIVAKATVFERMGADEKLHSVSLGEANVRVSIHSILLEKNRKAFLPIPIDDDIMTIESAIGTFVAWPKKWVITGNEMNSNSCNKSKDVDVGEVKSAEIVLKEFGVTIDDIISDPLHKEEMFPMDRGVFERDIDFYIALEEINDVCKNNRLNCPVIIGYMRYLYEKYESSRERYGFCYPGDTNQFDDEKRKVSSEMHLTIADRLQSRQRNQVILFPYCKDDHWVLIIIDLDSKTVYYLNSLESHKPRISTKSHVNAGISSQLMVNEGKRAMTPTWHYPKCPKQVGGFECGYFVMRFMRHFMEDPYKSLVAKLMELETKVIYTKAELNEVRIEFVTFIDKFI